MRSLIASSRQFISTCTRSIATNSRKKRNFATSVKLRPRLKTTAVDLDKTWYSSTRLQPSSLEMGRFGLRRLNYLLLEPPIWTIPPHPPTKSTSDRIVFPITLLAIGSIIAWAYLNPEDEDMKDYWKRVETGQILEEEDDGDELEDE